VVTGGTGLAPVRSMLNACYDTDCCPSVTLVSGFKNEEGIIFKEELEKWKTKFTTFYTLDRDQKEGWNVGFTTEYVGKADYASFGDNYEVVIVGPPAMMKFTALAAMKAGVPVEKIWVSFERKMSCAIGKCGHCRIDEVYVCLDGPVFNYTQAKDLID
ncbi:MAG: anaerobic sulfite reductase subunit AsrB, partial [Erysipelotrichaceae bacterium]|nr:anaerobic sulfite reductase subunit AsrB [Erysipelotrichaceae bacterium]